MRQGGTEVWGKWRGLISEQRQSGQKVAAFCRDRGLREWQFFAWKKRLREAEAAQFVEVEVRPAEAARRPTGEHGRGIEIRLSKGRSLMVEPGFDANHLRALLSVLEERA
jgi:hypothetical protein